MDNYPKIISVTPSDLEHCYCNVKSSSSTVRTIIVIFYVPVSNVSV